MNESRTSCPVCLQHDPVNIEVPSNHPLIAHLDCGYCGKFSVEQLVMFTMQQSEFLTAVQRAVLSCRIYRYSSAVEGALFQITNDVLENLRTSEGLYDPNAEAADLIRYIGDTISRTGVPISQFLGRDIQRSTCAPSMALAKQVFQELLTSGIIQGIDNSTLKEPGYRSVTLTLDGWRRYNAEKHGWVMHNYGFLAMEFLMIMMKMSMAFQSLLMNL